MTDTINEKAVVALEKRISPLATRATSITITTQLQQNEAGEMLTQLNKYGDEMKTLKETLTKPLNAALKAARELFKPREEKLEIAISSIRAEMGRYQLITDRKAKEEEARIAARVAPGKGNLRPETAVKKMDGIEKPDAKIETEGGSVKFRTSQVLKIKVYDAIMNHIADNRLMDLVELDGAALLKFLKEGNTVPGAELEEVRTVVNQR